jgi:hypothetical protein
MFKIQGCHQTMNVVTIDKVTSQPLSLHHGCNKRLRLPFVTQPPSKNCGMAVGPSSCSGLAAKVKGVGFPDNRVHLRDEKIHLCTNARYYLHHSHNVAASLLKFSQEPTV